MKAMVMTELQDLRQDRHPLEMRAVREPAAGEREVLIRVTACAVCHTELDEIEGRTPPPRLPVIPGHQVVGLVEKAGRQA